MTVSVELRVKNIGEVNRALTELGRGLRGALLETLKEAAVMVKEEALPLVRRRSGKTRRSIGYRVDEKNLAAYVGSTWFVSRFLEYGTVRMREMPFLRPALEKSMDRIGRLLETKIDAAIERAPGV